MDKNLDEAVIQSLTLRGCAAVPVRIRASYQQTELPGLSIEGMDEGASIVLRQTVRCALRSSGYILPRNGVHIDISPSKPGMSQNGLALPIAAAVLALSGQIPMEAVDGRVLVGDLGLDGAVLPCRGLRLYQLSAPRGSELVASANHGAAILDSELSDSIVLGISALADLKEDRSLQAELKPAPRVEPDIDLSDIEIGQSVARAIEIACAGGHNLVLSGADEDLVRKVAARVATCLPTASPEEMASAATLASIEDDPSSPSPIGPRPVRTWDAETDAAIPGLIGGGRPVGPGAVTLAGGGVLMIEHLDLMPTTTATILGQALKDGSVHVVRFDGVYDMPAKTMMVGCMAEGAEAPKALRALPCVCAEVGTGETVRVDSLEIRRRIEDAREFAATCEDRDEAYSDDPEDLIARTIADLDRSEHVYARHQEEAYRLTHKATGRPFKSENNPPALDSLANESRAAARACVSSPSPVESLKDLHNAR